jgi:hypothetical protein
MQHILNGGKDPYTRLPLAVEDLEPMPELYNKIQAWKRKQREGSTAVVN